MKWGTLFGAMLMALAGCTNTHVIDDGQWWRAFQTEPTHVIPHLLIIGDEDLTLQTQLEGRWVAVERFEGRCGLFPHPDGESVLVVEEGAAHLMVRGVRGLIDVANGRFTVLPDPNGEGVAGVVASSTRAGRYDLVTWDRRGTQTSKAALPLPPIDEAGHVCTWSLAAWSEGAPVLESESCGVVVVRDGTASSQTTLQALKRATVPQCFGGFDACWSSNRVRAAIEQ